MSLKDLREWLGARREAELEKIAIRGELRTLADQFRVVMRGGYGLVNVSEVEEAIKVLFDGGPWKIALGKIEPGSKYNYPGRIEVRVWCGPSERFLVTILPPVSRDDVVWINVGFDD